MIPTSSDYAHGVQRALAAVLFDGGHPEVHAHSCDIGLPHLMAADDGEQLAVCKCGVVVEIPGGIDMQMQARGLAPETAPPAAADPVHPGLPLVDPSQITTPEMLEAHLLDVIRRLEAGQLFERECIEAEYEARLAWEMAKAKTIAKGGGAADVRMAAALAEHGDLYEALLRAEMMRKATQAAMHNCRSMLSGYQTVSRSVQATYQAGGSPGPVQRGRY
jgi:hypothetical protein